jgi:hypothetical protein
LVNLALEDQQDALFTLLLEMVYLMQFLDRMWCTSEDIRNPFFTSEMLDEMVNQVPPDRWVFFKDMRNYLE